MQGTVRVYEIAEDLKMDTDAVLLKIRSLGIEVKNKMSKVDGAYLDQIRTSLLREKQAQFVEVEVAPGVKKLKRVEPPPPKPAPPKPVVRAVEAPVAKDPPKPEPVVAAEPVVAPVVEAKPAPEPEPAPKAESKPAPEPVVEAAPVVEAKPAPEPEPAPVAEPKVAAKPSTKGATKASAKTAPEPVVTAPVVEVKPAPEPVVEAPPVLETKPAPEPVALPTPPPPPPVVAAAEPEAAPEPTPAPAMPSTVVEEPPRPSVAPVPVIPAQAKTGIARWDPITRTVIYESSRPSQAPPMGGGLKPKSGWVEVKPPVGGASRRPTVGGRPMIGGKRPGTMIPGFQRASVKAPTLTEMAQHKKVIKIEAQISLQELARRMSLKATDVLLKLIQMGDKGKNINSTLDSDTAKLLASEFGYSVEDVALNVDDIIKTALPTFEPTTPVQRAPVVTVMGHVDHGKTTLLDAILGMRVAEGEAGGITQEVRAYRVSTAKGPVVFFDTPGHEAFTALRARGAQLTDVAVLVVAADDGVMPTTIEAISHAKAAGVPLVVAINKMDKPDANPERVINQLMQHDVIPEQFGGLVQMVKVSAKSRLGIEELLEKLALQAEILDLTADAKRPAVGTVFEAKLDKGRGPIARLLVQQGILRNGDAVLVGGTYGRVRAMYDDRGKQIDKAGPSTPVEIVGLGEVPSAGDKLHVAVDLRKAQEVAEQVKAAFKKPMESRMDAAAMVAAALSDSQQVNINVVVKADAQGAVEGLRKALTSLSTEKVRVSVIHGAVGAITETDVQLASASSAVIIGFNVRPAGKAQAAAEEARVALRFYSIIYEAVDDVKALMLGQLKPTLVKKDLGKAEVRQVFNITKTGVVAGCMVTDGAIKRNALARLVRDGAVKWEGKLGSLRRIKEDVKEVTQGFECGIALDNSPDIKPGDIIEAYELEEVAARL